jgi:hypothetical protein
MHVLVQQTLNLLLLGNPSLPLKISSQHTYIVCYRFVAPSTFPTTLYRLLKKVNHSANTVLCLSSRSLHSGTQSSGLRDEVARAREGSLPANTGFFGFNVSFSVMFLLIRSRSPDAFLTGTDDKGTFIVTEALGNTHRDIVLLSHTPHCRIRRRRCL